MATSTRHCQALTCACVNSPGWVRPDAHAHPAAYGLCIWQARGYALLCACVHAGRVLWAHFSTQVRLCMRLRVSHSSFAVLAGYKYTYMHAWFRAQGALL
jgi:hypothetical protein